VYDTDLDGLALDGLYEPEETLTPCGCRICTHSRWVPWETMKQKPGQDYVTGLPMVVIMPKGFTAWARKPPAAWVKWMADKEPKRKHLTW
jgi:hypothetical protein